MTGEADDVAWLRCQTKPIGRQALHTVYGAELFYHI